VSGHRVAGTTLARAAAVTVCITLAGSALGFVRDLLLARIFGADSGTDAFVVAWTVPETAFTLVVEGAMSFLMITLFSRALVEPGLSARDVVAATLPKVTAALVAASGLVVLGAPLLVRLIAPDLADAPLAVTCTRLTATTLLTFGLAGYLSSALRANHVFAAPAGIHLAYNTGILTLMLALSAHFGIVSAAAGVALGGLLMVVVQVPSFLRHVGLPSGWRRAGAATITLGAFVPLGAYTLTRQAQVFVERFFGSSLPPGTISYLNYAQKIAQLPMLVALLLCTVTFPTLARNVAAGEAVQARKRLESDLRTTVALILMAAAYLIAFAPQVVAVLLQHGEFSATDTAATAGILRVYAVGLVGHALVGVLARAYYAGDQKRTWYPAAAMAVGLTVTALLAAVGVPLLHAYGIAAANGAGILTTAVLLLVGLRHRMVAVSLPEFGGAVMRLAGAALVADLAGWAVESALAQQPAVVVVLAGVVVVPVVFVLLARVLGVGEVAALAAQLKRRIRHGR
jgi:putative peptidoglycan lipid II flippase